MYVYLVVLLSLLFNTKLTVMNGTGNILSFMTAVELYINFCSCTMFKAQRKLIINLLKELLMQSTQLFIMSICLES